MQFGFGAIFWSAIVIVAVIAGVGIMHFRFGFLRRSGKGERGHSRFVNNPRVEVLDSTVVDSDRRLLLVRCDDIEHLILVGGPTDLVVESDVRKVRGHAAGGAPAKLGAQSASAKRVTPLPQERTARAAPLADPLEHSSHAPRTAETARSEPRVGNAGRAPTPRPSPSASAQPLSRAPARESGLGGSRHEEAAPQRSNAVRAQAAEPPQPRREAPLRGMPQIQPALAGNRLAESRAQPGGDRPGRPTMGNGRDLRPANEFPAEGPWPEDDPLESEIVQALHVEPRLGSGAIEPRAEPTREAKASATTLGDLAERLEEALAREVQAASPVRRRPERDHEPPAPEPRTANPPLETRRRSDTKEKPEHKERPEPARMMIPAPEPERREPAQPDRREEAPVISLNSRRREPVDPLEDEMARLLGELTGDSKGR
jgi:hypothetical protein